MKFSAVIFDMDGVLIDSEAKQFELRQEFFRIRGLNSVPKEVFWACMGRTKSHLWEEVVKANPGTVQETLRDNCANFVNERMAYRELLNPGVISLLNGLLASGYKIGLATSTPRKKTERILKECEITHFFKVIVCGDEVPSSKPNPDIYLKAAKLLRVPPARCIVIEDSDNGVRAAKSAGMFVLGKRDIRMGQTLEGADKLIDSFSGLGLSQENLY